MLTLTSAMLIAATLVAPQRADTSIIVPAGSRLDVSSDGGEIRVDTWERSEVRVRAEYRDGQQISVAPNGPVTLVRSESRRRGIGIVNYQITVPRTMDLDLSSMAADITVADSRGRVDARTVMGDISVSGATARVSVETVQGDLVVQDATGAVRARSVGGAVWLQDVSGGPVDAQAVSGRVVLDGIDSNQVHASSVSGRVFYDGAIQPNGRYNFVSHSGSLTVAMPQDLNATVSVAVLSGSVHSSFPAIELANSNRGRQQTFVVGSGSAVVETESFSGSIRLVRRGEAEPPGGVRRGTI